MAVKKREKRVEKLDVVFEEIKMATCTKKQEVVDFIKLGKPIGLSPKSRMSVNSAGFKVEYHVPTMSLVVRIGDKEVGDFVITKEAWEELKQGGEVQLEFAKAKASNVKKRK